MSLGISRDSTASWIKFHGQRWTQPQVDLTPSWIISKLISIKPRWVLSSVRRLIEKLSRPISRPPTIAVIMPNANCWSRPLVWLYSDFITAALWFRFSRCQWARRSKADDVINLLSSRTNDVLPYFSFGTRRARIFPRTSNWILTRKCYFWKPGVGEKMIFHARAHSRDQRAAKKKKEKFSTSFHCSSNSRKKPISSSPSWPTLSKQPKIFTFPWLTFLSFSTQGEKFPYSFFA